ncbi:hypothetical protein POTOM_001631 [Populus tomentosa]|uniref:Uncharacterized protein n=1 Tax=Populus tomentosa TaxID=118781 RepID=A0A8X8IVP2_POPTO|nr:hypothetical protein POTOM_001631 [Populus tomentosa]
MPIPSLFHSLCICGSQAQLLSQSPSMSDLRTYKPIGGGVIDFIISVQVLDALELSRLAMKTVKQNLWWAFAYNIVGIPIAAGMLLPVNGTILTPSIAGALMGLSSIGVMTNSLLLRFKFSLKQKKVYGASPNTKIGVDSVLLYQKEKTKQPYSDSQWREV